MKQLSILREKKLDQKVAHLCLTKRQIRPSDQLGAVSLKAVFETTSWGLVMCFLELFK